MMYVVKREDAEPLSSETFGIFTMLTLREIRDTAIPVSIAELRSQTVSLPFFIEVVLKRIEVLNLPIKFTFGAVMLFGLLPNVVGGAVVMLIDLLENFAEKSVVDIDDVSSTYPSGFYSDEAFLSRAEFIKSEAELPAEKRTVKYGYVY